MKPVNIITWRSGLVGRFSEPTKETSWALQEAFAEVCFFLNTLTNIFSWFILNFSHFFFQVFILSRL